MGKDKDRVPARDAVQYSEGETDEFEFGGPFGTAALMIGFPLLMWFVQPSSALRETSTGQATC